MNQDQIFDDSARNLAKSDLEWASNLMRELSGRKTNRELRDRHIVLVAALVVSAAIHRFLGTTGPNT